MLTQGIERFSIIKTFYASIRIEMKRIGTLKAGDTPIGTQVKVRIAKNKVGAPFRQVELDIMFGTGISRAAELMYLGEQFELIKNNMFGDVKLGRGHDSSISYIAKTPQIAEQLEAAIRAV